MSESKDLLPSIVGSNVTVQKPPHWLVRAAPPASWLAGIVVLHHIGLLNWAIGFAVVGGMLLGVRTLLHRIEANAAPSNETDPLKQLKRGLSRCQYTPGLEGLSERAQRQLEQVQERHRSFLRILRERLDTGELTYGRYSGAMDQVAQGIVDSLKLALEELMSVTSQRADEAETRSKTLQALATPNDADRSEIEALRQRLAIRDEHLATVARILASNEQALTELDHAISAITMMKAGARQSPTDLDAAMKELEVISARARKSNPST